MRSGGEYLRDSAKSSFVPVLGLVSGAPPGLVRRCISTHGWRPWAAFLSPLRGWVRGRSFAPLDRRVACPYVALDLHADTGQRVDSR